MRHECIDMKVDYEKVDAVWDGTQPKLYTYILDESEELFYSHKRPAVIVCPGGAYRFKSDREAEVVAMKYLAAGNQAFVLQYSVAPSRYPSAMLELATAVAYVRSHAREYHIDPEKIVITGFSAGGHLCCSLGNLWDEPVIEKALTDAYPVIEGKKMWKPDGMILCYPVVTMGEFTHEESRELLLGPGFTEEMANALSLESRVSEKTVPTFLWHTQEDQDVPVENSLQLAVALRRNHVPFELHIYEKGCHGLSLCEKIIDNGTIQIPEDNAGWMDLALRWLRRL
ncbi:MAG: alpha/beta hydrolase [Clostridia bacterium]|nr:alpha/beta hydrolase [Clostridia bacterium]NCC43501.1 alpha/beta hydrolase [Clostridia bacterium]